MRLLGRAVCSSTRARRALACLAALALGTAGWFWLRDSSFVAVERVEIRGLSIGDRTSIRSALNDAAATMTTLHVREDDLRSAVSAHAVVAELHAEPDFPHGLRIDVVHRSPIAAITVGARRLAVSDDGTILRDVRVARGLPTVPLATPPGSRRITERRTLAALALVAAAPSALRGRIDRVRHVRLGLIAELEAGPELRFGSSGRLAAKWLAAARVLADSDAVGARYLDVRIAERPAVGGLGEGEVAEPLTLDPAPTTVE